MNYLFHDNKYTRWYFSIISNRKNRDKSLLDYSEEHHIIPKSMGGDNSKNNLIYLTFKEHFLVHMLLIKMCKSKIHILKMNRALIAFRRYDPTTQDRKITSRQFEEIKKASKLANSGINHPCYGKVLSDETKRKISEANRKEKNGMYNNGKPLSESHKNNIKQSLSESEKLKNRGESWKQNISASLSKPIAFVSIETNEIVFTFKNCNEAATFLGCNKSNITNALRTNRIVGKKIKTIPKCRVIYLPE